MPATRIVAPSVEQQKKYYVYTLAYPDDIVFYVGKGQDDRIDRHEHDACRSDEAIKSRYLNLEKCQVIRTIWEQCKQVKKNIVFETDIELDAYIYEWVLINMVYADQLVNIHLLRLFGFSCKICSSTTHNYTTFDNYVALCYNDTR